MNDEELKLRGEKILSTMKRITGKANPNQIAGDIGVTDWAIHKWIRQGYVPMRRVLKLELKYKGKFERSELNHEF